MSKDVLGERENLNGRGLLRFQEMLLPWLRAVGVGSIMRDRY